jgi:NADH-quinone oxidoreductase subunit N
MNQVLTWTDLAPAGAEIFLLAAACAILLVDLALGDRRRWITYVLSIVALTGAAVLGTVLKLVNYAVVAVALLYSRDYLDRRGLFKGEYFVLSLFAVLGINVMISAGSLLSMYLGIEILSL